MGIFPFLSFLLTNPWVFLDSCADDSKIPTFFFNYCPLALAGGRKFKGFSNLSFFKSVKNKPSIPIGWHSKRCLHFSIDLKNQECQTNSESHGNVPDISEKFCCSAQSLLVNCRQEIMCAASVLSIICLIFWVYFLDSQQSTNAHLHDTNDKVDWVQFKSDVQCLVM